MRPIRHLIFTAVLAALCSLPGFAQETAALPYVAGSWTLALLPDTQVYAAKLPELFTKQTQWIADSVKPRDIRIVLTEGDITDDNSARQWGNARCSLSVLDGVVPYVLVTGNHDYIKNTSLPKLDTLMNVFFPICLFDRTPTFGGVYQRDKLDNAYYLFDAGGRNWVVISLEFGPRDEVVRWANVVLDKFADRSAMIVTHTYLDNDGARIGSGGVKPGYQNPHNGQQAKTRSVNDGEELWTKLVSQHANVAFVFCGHIIGNGGAARLTSDGVHGNKVHQILADYQDRAEGGEGYLRLVEFLPDGKTVQVKTYSPHLDKYLTDDKQQFTLDLPPTQKAEL